VPPLENLIKNNDNKTKEEEKTSAQHSVTGQIEKINENFN